MGRRWPARNLAVDACRRLAVAPECEPELQAADFLVDHSNVHRLLAGFSAQFVQVEVSTIDGDLAHAFPPDFTQTGPRRPSVTRICYRGIRAMPRRPCAPVAPAASPN